MGFILVDGKGGGYTAQVTSTNRLRVAADTTNRFAGVSQSDGEAYSLTTDFVALTTTGSYTGLCYLKNTGSTILRIWGIYTSCEAANQWRLIAKPTTGTLISAGTAITASNMALNRTKTLSATTLKGADAQTITDGTLFAQWASSAGVTRRFAEGGLILGTDDALALEVKPAAAGDAAVNILMTQESDTEV